MCCGKEAAHLQQPAAGEVTGAKTEIGPIWGDGEVNELLLPAASRGEVN